MNKEYYRLLPEVPGELGERTRMDRSFNPPKISYLHFIFSGWLGDELIECFPCYLVTDTLLKYLNDNGLTGFFIKEAEISYSSLFNELYPNRGRHEFKWLVITGQTGDDFFLSPENYLVVTNRCLNVLKEHGNLNNCEIEKF